MGHCRARRHPQAAPQVARRGFDPSSPAAYRWPVTPCRRVPHVHDPPPGGRVGGRCRPKSRRRQSSRTDPSVEWTPLETHRRDSREQAYVPAEQPSSSQGARFPSAHADPRRSLDPVRPSPQGPQGAWPSDGRARGITPCCPPRIVSSTVTLSVVTVRSGRRCRLVDPRGPPLGGCERDDRSRPGRVHGEQGRRQCRHRNRVKRRLRHLTREHLPALEELSGSCCARGPCAAGLGRRRRTPELGADLARSLAG